MKYVLLLVVLFLVACSKSNLAVRSYRSFEPCEGVMTQYGNGYYTWFELLCADTLIINPFNVKVRYE